MSAERLNKPVEIAAHLWQNKSIGVIASFVHIRRNKLQEHKETNTEFGYEYLSSLNAAEPDLPQKASAPDQRRMDRLSDEIKMLRAVSTVLLVFIAILCIATAAIVIIASRNAVRDVIDSMPEAIESSGSSSEKIELELSQLYKSLEGLGNVVYGNAEDRILINDSTYGEIWIPTLKEVEKNPYDPALFINNDGVMQYADSSVKTFRGIDVSNYQGEIDWKRVKASGIDFAMIRVGYRGYSKGTVLIDESFESNMKGAAEAGVDVGVYFFSQATTVQEAIEEAWTVIDCIKDYDITYPVVFDWEIIFGEAARTDSVSVAGLTQSAVAFCDVIESKGYKAMIYFNKRLGLLKYNLADLNKYGFWYAQYYDVPEFYYKFDMWQYSCTGTVDGVNGEVDMNICFTDYAASKNTVQSSS